MKLRTWAGNVRELENFIERLVTLTNINQKIIDKKVFPAEIQKEYRKIKRNSTLKLPTKSLSESLADYEEDLMRQTLIACKWNQSKSARILGISEHDIRYKMKKLNIKRPN